MKNGYQLLITLTNTLNSNENIIKELLKNGKETFSKNEKKIMIGVSIIKEIENILIDIDKEIFILNKNLYEKVTSIINYSKHIFNNYHIVNSYKLYDVLNIDVIELKTFLNQINN